MHSLASVEGRSVLSCCTAEEDQQFKELIN